MAQVSVHQDLCAYERKRGGFTTRQIVGLAGCGVIVVGGCALTLYGLQLPLVIGLSLSLILGSFPLACGFAPIWGMTAEDWFLRLMEFRERGNAVCWEGEHVENQKGVITREYKKAKARCGSETRSYSEQA